MGNIQRAVDTYRRAVAIEPKFADAYNNLGAPRPSSAPAHYRVTRIHLSAATASVRL